MKLYPQLLRGVVLPFMSKVKGKPLTGYVTEYSNNLKKSPEALQQLQWQALTRLLNHAFEQCPFYRERWQNAGIDDIRTVDSMKQFQQLPILTKDDIRQNYQQLR